MKGLGVRLAAWRWLWSWGTWWASFRRPRVRPEDVRRHLYRQQTRGMGVRWSEWLRDRLRPTWLRLRREDRGTDGD
ncbi:MAG: hypothetical protein PVJ57_04460 [Phycisphaerae bacterium]